MKKFAHSAAVLAIVSGVLATTVPVVASASQAANPKTLRVGFVPSSNATTMEARAKPLGQMLSKQLGQKVVVTVSTDYNSIVEALGSGKIDIGFLPPDGYVQAHKQYGARVLLQTVRNGVNNDGSLQKKMVSWYRALILVRKDSKVKSIKDLTGKNIAVQDVTSSSGYIFPIYYLKSKGINVVKNSNLVTVKGHDQGVLAVENKQADAAFVFQDARNIVKGDVPTIFKDTKILAETMKIPNDTVTARKSLSKKLSTKVQNAFIKIAKTKKGNKLVENLYDIAGFAKSKNSNFAVVRKADKAVTGN
ncbi:phosphate/phosphite/phosphonate ABC transporter substrate-binding protein [Oenococcus kitaharae]|uniref:Phosphonate ABC transporter phosphate-binding periplasmic component n=1 Tax=Oenococcus kitaharae DSM 17330 TaxID=1045004 RepID=G9WJ30_9LACO|nr:phosphate/phosphite/phosphonate ABC transporter substrate-binding protein [Oenococcus kitaharae]EHN58479.1 Phosphonate ABC transporter phosphate-binding periplasmic component [Oenococcus kitaharae DSM 17330]MCV3296282.1 phosphate/phosphite/phosphonate ABC transporter substrate-binding protein [Oenococcus kitaharae]OEY81367.1 phosphonate-binding protein [Oenococcus kitaharae]OEY82855.1 phosphonate-binding protein [Oenococcus kitaharae]OEY84601.1 phosphonate-binding protein [Oenococcus kitaha